MIPALLAKLQVDATVLREQAAAPNLTPAQALLLRTVAADLDTAAPLLDAERQACTVQVTGMAAAWDARVLQAVESTLLKHGLSGDANPVLGCVCPTCLDDRGVRPTEVAP